MTHYKNFDFSVLHNRLDVHYLDTIAALDVVVSDAGLISLWGFCLDNAPQSHVYGRTLDDLADFLEMLQDVYKLHSNHKIVCFVDDLPGLFWRTHKKIRYAGDFISRNTRSTMLATYNNCIEFRSFAEYYEQNIDVALPHVTGCAHPAPPAGNISDACELRNDDILYIDNRISFIAAIMRYDCDADYHGTINNIPLTKTARISRLFDAQKRKSCNGSRCNVNTQIMTANPLKNEEQRKTVLPQLKHAFFGGVNFINDDFVNDILQNVHYGDFTSAYIAQMILKKYPVGKFEALQVPADPEQLLTAPYYTGRALLITFDVPGLRLRPGGVPFLMSDMRHNWVDAGDKNEMQALCDRSYKRRIYNSDSIRLTLTDIDFKLLMQNYSLKKSADGKNTIRILSVYGAKYGFLPDYILKVLYELYKTKVDAKEALKAKEQAGVKTLQDDLQYEDIKSIPARVYGIFTKSPVLVKYKYDPEQQAVSVDDPQYISQNAKFSSVLYQWGVWTTAHVRRELLHVRRAIISAGGTAYYGDTDSCTFTATPAALETISNYNAMIAMQLGKRAQSLGVDPHDLRGLGSFDVKQYRYFRYTGTKQYCYCHDTDAGLKFEFRAAGLNRGCTYFDDLATDPLDKLYLFAKGFEIPAKYQPRKVAVYTPTEQDIAYIDRDGQEIRRTLPSSINYFYDAYTLGGNMQFYNSAVSEFGTPLNINNLSAYANKIRGFAT